MALLSIYQYAGTQLWALTCGILCITDIAGKVVASNSGREYCAQDWEWYCCCQSTLNLTLIEKVTRFVSQGLKVVVCISISQ